jgi:hypothetical protein
MSIKVKNSQLDSETIQAINNLSEIDINASVAFKLVKIIKELSSIIDDKSKMEKKIFDKWVEKDENGNPVPGMDKDGNILPDSFNLKDPQSYIQEMNMLMETENEIPFEKINFEDLNLKTAKVKDLMKLDFLFN